MIKNYHYMKWNKREDDMLLDMRKKGFSFYRIAHEFGLTRASVISRWHKIKPKKSNKEVLRIWSCTI